MNAATREALEILIEELRKGAAGPCDYWYRQLATRLAERVMLAAVSTPSPSDIEEKGNG
jgi:hypothetical protein